MNITEYQAWVAKMWSSSRPLKAGKREYTLKDNYVMTTGLAGETAEVVEAVLKFVVAIGKVTERSKKDVRDERKLEKKELTKELGDALYYLLAVAHKSDIKAQDIINVNVDKLTKRYAKKKYARKAK
jgi:NTP pyrophosphatase (non-canonical NTP hydrolase)